MISDFFTKLFDEVPPGKIEGKNYRIYVFPYSSLHDFINKKTAEELKKRGVPIEYDEKNPEVLEDFLNKVFVNNRELHELYCSEWEKKREEIVNFILGLNNHPLVNDGGSPQRVLFTIGYSIPNFADKNEYNESKKEKWKKILAGLFAAGVLILGVAAGSLYKKKIETSTTTETKEKEPTTYFSYPEKPNDNATFCVESNLTTGKLIIKENGVEKIIPLFSQDGKLCATFPLKEGNHSLESLVLENKTYKMNYPPFSIYDTPKIRFVDRKGSTLTVYASDSSDIKAYIECENYKSESKCNKGECTFVLPANFEGKCKIFVEDPFGNKNSIEYEIRKPITITNTATTTKPTTTTTITTTAQIKKSYCELCSEVNESMKKEVEIYLNGLPDDCKNKLSNWIKSGFDRRKWEQIKFLQSLPKEEQLEMIRNNSFKNMDLDGDGISNYFERFIGNDIFSPFIKNNIYWIEFDDRINKPEYKGAINELFKPKELIYNVGLDMTWDNFVKTIDDLSKKVGEDDIVVVSLGSHGSVGVFTFVCKEKKPSCSPIKGEPFFYEIVSYSDINEQLEKLRPKVMIIDVSACYNDSSKDYFMNKTSETKRILLLADWTSPTIPLVRPRVPYLEKVSRDPSIYDLNKDCYLTFGEFLKVTEENYPYPKVPPETVEIVNINREILDKIPLHVCKG
ncbi:MAG: hypothetical protein QXD89_01365 [Candidatus Aenigmatarchaeota archaeon]